MKHSCLALLAAAALTADAGAQEWSRFRGPDGTGISRAKNVPVKWTEKDFNWKIKLQEQVNRDIIIKEDLEKHMCDSGITHDDTIGAHSERISHELANVDLASPLNVRGTAFKPDHVTLVKLQLHSVFDRHDSLVVGYEP